MLYSIIVVGESHMNIYYRYRKFFNIEKTNFSVSIVSIEINIQYYICTNCTHVVIMRITISGRL